MALISMQSIIHQYIKFTGEVFVSKTFVESYFAILHLMCLIIRLLLNETMDSALLHHFINVFVFPNRLIIIITGKSTDFNW